MIDYHWRVIVTCRLELSAIEVQDIAQALSWRDAQVTYFGDERNELRVSAPLVASNATTAVLDLTAAVGNWLNLHRKNVGFLHVDVERTRAFHESADDWCGTAALDAVGATPVAP